MRRLLFVFSLALIALVGSGGDPAFATQAHSAPEGLYTHQFAHIFFLGSMGILIYWLRERRLVQITGWRYIQYSAFFFILWNLDAFTVHLLDEQLAVIQVARISAWDVVMTTPSGSRGLLWLYYAAKLDNLLCVPALLFLYFGLRRLLRETDLQPTRSESP